MASSLDSLGDGWSQSLRADQPWHVGWPDGTHPYPWPAEIDPWIFYLIQRNAQVDVAYSRLEAQFNTGWDTGTLPRFMGAFRNDTAGRVSFRQSTPLGSNDSLVIEAVRLSAVTVRRPY